VRPRPRPHVVAHGHTTNAAIPPAEAPQPTGAIERTAGLFTKRFGLVSAYDGDRVGIGRVVVDSTWHHWFSYNLHDFKSANQPMYRLMQAYYRNVALWLATPTQRQTLLFAATWGTVVSDPMAFPAAPRRSIWAVGERAVAMMSRTVSPCTLFEFVASPFNGLAETLGGADSSDPAAPLIDGLRADLAVRAIVGGVASSLITPAYEYLQAHNTPRRLLDAEAITRAAADGLQHGHRALLETVRSSAAASTTLAGRLDDAFKPPPSERIPVELLELRLIAERLQLPDPTDPAFAGVTTTAIFVRVTASGTPVASERIELSIPRFQPGGAFIDLDRVLFEGVIQSGETLTIVIAASDQQHNQAPVMFSSTITADASTIGRTYHPTRSQPWRLWYRIEETSETRGA
jgi:hypothetical protein